MSSEANDREAGVPPSSERARWTGAEDILRRYVKAKEDRDLEALVACWHPDIEAYHPLRPDRSWRGIETYRRAWAAILANPEEPFELVHADVVGNRIYSETVTRHADGTAVPCLSILEVEDGQIRRARVFTDRPVHDGKSMDDWVDEMNTGAASGRETQANDREAGIPPSSERAMKAGIPPSSERDRGGGAASGERDHGRRGD